MAPTALTWAKHFAFFSQTCLIQIRSVGISPNWDWFWIFFHSISTSFHSLTQSLHCYCSCAFILVWRFSSKNCAIYFVQPRIVRGCCQTPLTMPNCTPWCCLRTGAVCGEEPQHALKVFAPNYLRNYHAPHWTKDDAGTQAVVSPAVWRGSEHSMPHRLQCVLYMLTFGFVPNNLDIAFGKANVFKNQIHSKSHSSRLLCLWFCVSTQGSWCSETSFLATLVVSAAHKIWVATAIASTSAAQVISDGIVVPSFWPCQYSLRLNTYENISHCIAETWFQQAFQSLP